MPNAKPLQRVQPEDVGIPSSAVSALFDALASSGQEIHSLMLVRRAMVAAEAWWKPYAPELPHALYSLSKAFTSTAVGMLVGEGKLSVDQPVVELLPEDSPARPSRYLRALTVRHLLTMSTGHAADPLQGLHKAAPRNWARYILRSRLEKQPGSVFLYNSSATYLLSAIAQKLTGQRLLDYLKPRLFDPLGIVDATWERCPRGIDAGGWGLSLTTEDIAKFGLLYLGKGEWEGRRLVPAQWVADATRTQISTAERNEPDWAQGYGYQFWRCRNGAYRGDGAFGQYCLVMPDHDAVMAMTSGAQNMQAILDAVWSTLLPAMRPAGEVVRTVKKHQVALRRTCATRRLDPPVFHDHPNASRVDGTTWALDENPHNLKSVTLTLLSGRLVVKLKGKRSAAYRCGAGRWASGKARPMVGRDKTSFPVRSAYTWTPEGVLQATVRFIATPHAETWSFRFLPEGIEMSSRRNVSFEKADETPLRGRRAAAG